MNARLKGYTVRIEKLDFHPIGLSLDLKKLWIYQTPQPDPPIAYILNLHTSVHWKAFLSGRWSAIFKSSIPKFTLTLDSSSRSQGSNTDEGQKAAGRIASGLSA
jgi:hypothetical protein